jgi:hypothetical protein
MTRMQLALGALVLLAACSKNQGTEQGGMQESTGTENTTRTEGTTSIGNSAGSYPAGSATAPTDSTGVGATGVSEPIDQPPPAGNTANPSPNATGPGTTIP